MTIFGSTNRVNFVFTKEGLLSGGRSLTNCKDANDPTCEGGVAAVSAYARYIASENNEPSLVIPYIDYKSSFVQLHPLRLVANRLIFNHLLGFKVFMGPSWFINSEEAQNQDLSGLQTEDFPLLISNVAVPSSNSWYHYLKGVYFDEDTGLAVMFLGGNVDTKGLHWPDAESAMAMLDHITRVNEQSGCIENVNAYDVYLNQTHVPMDERRCWVPVVLVDGKADLSPTWQALAEHSSPPAVIVDLGGRFSFEGAEEGTQIGQVGTKGVWAVNYDDGGDFENISIELDEDRKNVVSVSVQTGDIEELPAEAKDEKYASDIIELRKYADEAVTTDPVIGRSNKFPFAKGPTDEGWVYVRCEAGECEHGNMVTDAMRWYTKSDFAWSNSGAYNGPGWPEGDVRVSDLWGMFPFSNTLCTGTMSGISLFKMFSFSVTSATFSAENTEDGGDLLQVSGLRVTYNTELEGSSRLVGLKMWNETTQEFEPVERLKMYTFASDSYNCQFNDPFNLMSGDMLTIPGEVPGQVGNQNLQEAVAKYLTHIQDTDGIYIGQLEGRLVNNTDATVPMNLIQTEAGCDSDTYWSPEYQTCFGCPSIDGVSSTEKMTFQGVSQTSFVDSGEVVVENTNEFPVKVYLKNSPPFMSYSGSISGFGQQKLAVIDASSSLALEFSSNSNSLFAGTALGEIVIGLSDGGTFPGCLGNDIRLEVEVKVRPNDELNQLGGISAAGWTTSAVVILATLLTGGWVVKHRKHSVIKKMQPPFLFAILLGVLLLGSTIIPMSIDDGIASEAGCSIACMATPWLLSMGMSLTFKSLFSKLWRINRLFSSGHRRVALKEKDVALPGIIMFSLNLIILICWSAIDPLRWERVPVDGETWNTYGVCQSENVALGRGLWGAIGFVNVGALLASCHQAYKARDHSDEFSEAKGIGIAMYSWLQLAVVGIPVTLLIDETDTKARYFVNIGLIFAVSTSLLVSIFLPIRKNKKAYDSGSRRTETRISGIDMSRVSQGVQRNTSMDNVNKFGSTAGAQESWRGGGGGGGERRVSFDHKPVVQGSVPSANEEKKEELGGDEEMGVNSISKNDGTGTPDVSKKPVKVDTDISENNDSEGGAGADGNEANGKGEGMADGTGGAGEQDNGEEGEEEAKADEPSEPANEKKNDAAKDNESSTNDEKGVGETEEPALETQEKEVGAEPTDAEKPSNGGYDEFINFIGSEGNKEAK